MLRYPKFPQSAEMATTTSQQIGNFPPGINQIVIKYATYQPNQKPIKFLPVSYFQSLTLHTIKIKMLSSMVCRRVANIAATIHRAAATKSMAAAASSSVASSSSPAASSLLGPLVRHSSTSPQTEGSQEQTSVLTLNMLRNNPGAVKKVRRRMVYDLSLQNNTNKTLYKNRSLVSNDFSNYIFACDFLQFYFMKSISF